MKTYTNIIFYAAFLGVLLGLRHHGADAMLPTWYATYGGDAWFAVAGLVVSVVHSRRSPYASLQSLFALAIFWGMPLCAYLFLSELTPYQIPGWFHDTLALVMIAGAIWVGLCTIWPQRSGSRNQSALYAGQHTTHEEA